MISIIKLTILAQQFNYSTIDPTKLINFIFELVDSIPKFVDLMTILIDLFIV